MDASLEDDFFGDIFVNEAQPTVSSQDSSVPTNRVKNPPSEQSTSQRRFRPVPVFLSGNIDDFDIDLDTDLPDWSSIKEKHSKTKELSAESKRTNCSKNVCDYSDSSNSSPNLLTPSNRKESRKNSSPNLLTPSTRKESSENSSPNLLTPSNRKESSKNSHKTPVIRNRTSMTEVYDFEEPELNFSSSNDTSISTNGRKRKFPGPAGLLPQIPTDQIRKLSQFVKVKKIEESLDSNLESVELPCSQVDESDFNQGPWLQAMRDLRLNDLSNSSPLSKYTISWLLKKANLKQLPNSKMPMLVAVIKSINIKATVASIILKDKTGEIPGTIIQELIDEYISILKAGTVLVLQQVSVFSPTKRKHYLNITPKNIACIYITREYNRIECMQLENGDLTEHLIDITKRSESLVREDHKRVNLSPVNSNVNFRQTIKAQQMFSIVEPTSSANNLHLNTSKAIADDDWGDDDYDEIMCNIDEQQLINAVYNIN